ncbi:MAG TPA: tetratricopeptide repeat protein [Kofleriaceae bacterium]|nr:tetratricopeptide repeat protein [Kofleriaceae bacterium]
MTGRFALAVALAVALALAAACGAPARKVGTTTPTGGAGSSLPAAPADPVKPEARRQFEAAVRALRLGGPESVETARERFQEALRQDDKLWEAWHDLGVLDARAGDDDGAIAAFDKAIALAPGHTPSRLARAEAHRRAGHTKEARADYQAILADALPDDPLRKDAAAREASLLRTSGDYDAAVDVLRDTLRRDGPSAGVYTELGLVYLAQDREDLADLVLRKAADLDGKNPATMNAMALLAQRQGNSQEAFERFDRATALDPGYLDARFNKASVLLDAGDYARAATELSQVVAKRPDDWEAQVALGLALRGQKDFDGARKAWQLVVDKAPRRSRPRGDALWNLTILEEDFLDDNATAKTYLERFLQDAGTAHPKRLAAEQKQKELRP